ncbi:hypothetical protein ACFLXI_00220 [Chloroflexota bacterium]
MSRWVRFLIVIIIGLALGLLYGWLIDPVDFVDTTPNTLRSDYKTDYVLMVAEIYSADRDAESAVIRLTFLGDPSPVDTIENAMIFAVDAGYAPDDLRKLRDLSDALAPLTQPSGGGSS